MNGLLDLGTPVTLCETRTAAVCRDSRTGDERLVIAAKGLFLSVNPENGIVKQFDLESDDYPYVSFSTSDGFFCSGAGSFFYCLDPFREKWVCKSREGGEAAVFAITESEEGTVYFISYPDLHVRTFDPRKKKVRSLLRLSSGSKYAGTLAAGEGGWVYAGIGTEHASIIAFHPETGEQKVLTDSAPRKGTGYVRKGSGGKVYAQYSSFSLRESVSGEPWAELSAGKHVQYVEAPLGEHEYWGSGFQTCHRQLKGAEKAVSFDLTEKELVLSTKKWPLEYLTKGAELSTVAAGPDGNIYGTSMHPMRLFKANENGTDLLGAFEGGGGGNVCTYAVRNGVMFGCAYAGGKIYEWNPAREEKPAPLLIGKTEEVHRPRASRIHPFEQKLVFTGFPGYGSRGGAIGVYNPLGRIFTVLPPEQLIPDQSTVSFAFDAAGDLIGATSVLTPGGAAEVAESAVLYRLDWKTKRVAAKTVPFPGEKELTHISLSAAGAGTGITRSSVLFSFDSESLNITRKLDVAAYGEPVRGGSITEGSVQFYLFQYGIIRTDHYLERTEVLPLKIKLTSGGAISRGKLYFCSNNRLLALDYKRGGLKWRTL